MFRYLFQNEMSRSRRVAVIAFILLTSQILRLFFENWYLFSGNINYISSAAKDIGSIRVVPPSIEHEGGYLVNRFYKSEGFGMNDLKDPADVTLVMHGTVDRLYRLIEIAEVWSGPISMAVYAPMQDASFFDDAIDGLRLCWATLRKSVSFHLVHHVNSPANVTQLGSFVYLSCKDIIRRLRLVRPNAGRSQYPHNLLRNVGRSGALTNFVLHIDADLAPSRSLRGKFKELLKLHNLESGIAARSSKLLFVLPVFELRQFQNPVRTKQELAEAIKERNAIPFLQETCVPCHRPTDYDRWLQSLKSDSNDSEMSYKVDYVKEWTPFFITSKHSPLYDDRFVAFGHDVLANICELQANGYEFHVLTHEFLIHNGYRTKSRMTEFERTRRDDRATFYDKFLQELRENGLVGSMYNNCYD
uniref:beta-1,4-glucuronyltransferase 1-like isoform X1 n=2 Tax=Ciona intestinalis TaxID=7719 RepID=UPI00089DC179|nr:beta-1,4-glucuronyltransferase 1-like isoform X1 [Ciona intestinalis]|eukprot:XP_018669725.1 beta-1,4-glucuronyltransferase 1-like isoform X1 [Ciona intestinalis]